MKPALEYFTGWWLVLISALALFLGPTPILTFSFGVFLKPLAVRGANKSIQDWTEVCRQRAAKINGRFDLHRSYPTPSICLRSVFK